MVDPIPVYQSNIYISSASCYIADFDNQNYNIKNFTGYQFCVRVHFAVYGQSNTLPLSLFNGKREGDQVIIHYSKQRDPFSVVATCNQIGSPLGHLGPFEQALYKASYKLDAKNLTTLQILVAYHSHINYAKSLNFPIKLYLKTYEPLLLIDYIAINCTDIHGLLKNLYYLLFIKNPPTLRIID